MTEKRKQPFDVQAANPRYKGVRLSDAARALTRPKNPAARATLDRLQGRPVPPEKAGAKPSAVKSA